MGNEKKIFTAEMKAQMNDVFGKMEKSLVLKLCLDKSELSNELAEYIEAMAELTDKLTVEIEDKNADSDIAPCVKVCHEDGSESGLAFHGVPTGHEFTSFIVGLYNTAGSGQPTDEGIKERIEALSTPLDIKVLVTVSCSMCPDLVIAAQYIAAKNSGVKAHIYDIMHFDKLRNKYNVMSVPCLVVNDDKVSFGRKNIRELLDFIEK